MNSDVMDRRVQKLLMRERERENREREREVNRERERENRARPSGGANKESKRDKGEFVDPGPPARPPLPQRLIGKKMLNDSAVSLKRAYQSVFNWKLFQIHRHLLDHCPYHLKKRGSRPLRQSLPSNILARAITVNSCLRSNHPEIRSCLSRLKLANLRLILFLLPNKVRR